MKRVNWTETKYVNRKDHKGFIEKAYSGEIIGTHYNWFWDSTHVVVACDDGEIRTIEASNVEVEKNETVEIIEGRDEFQTKLELIRKGFKVSSRAMRITKRQYDEVCLAASENSINWGTSGIVEYLKYNWESRVIKE